VRGAGFIDIYFLLLCRTGKPADVATEQTDALGDSAENRRRVSLLGFWSKILEGGKKLYLER